MKGHGKIVIVLILGLICAGCSSGSHFSLRSSQDAKAGNLSKIEKYGADSPPILYAGSEFTYQDLSVSGGRVSRISMEVKERKQFEHKPAYWIEVTEKGISYFNIYDMNLNWIGMFGEGRELESAEPCFEMFRWPLEIGKDWNSGYVFRDYSDHSHDAQIHKSEVHVNIQSYEEVGVPAGTFKALKIQAGRETFWYAPCIGWIVKEELGTGNQNGRILELVEYHISGSR